LSSLIALSPLFEISRVENTIRGAVSPFIHMPAPEPVAITVPEKLLSNARQKEKTTPACTSRRLLC